MMQPINLVCTVIYFLVKPLIKSSRDTGAGPAPGGVTRQSRPGGVGAVRHTRSSLRRRETENTVQPLLEEQEERPGCGFRAKAGQNHSRRSAD